MFDINFNIVKSTENLLKNMTLEEFDYDYGDIEGQLRLNFNGTIKGYVDSDYNFADKLLLFWYESLNKIVHILKSNKYAAFEIPDTDGIWIEFLNKGEFLVVSEKKLNWDNVEELVIDNPINDFEDFGWSNITIDKNEFLFSVLQSTKELLDRIATININLMEARNIKELNFIYESNL